MINRKEILQDLVGFNEALIKSCENNQEDKDPEFSSKMLRLNLWKAIRLIEHYQLKEEKIKDLLENIWE